MKYKINKDKILEVLNPYDDSLFFGKENDNLYSKYDKDFIFIFYDLRIVDIKNNTFDSSNEMIRRFIIEKLHPYFNECFEEIEPKYDYEKVCEFLKKSGYTIHNGCIFYDAYKDSSSQILSDSISDIVKALNGEKEGILYKNSNIIYTLLKGNKEQLLED